MNKVCDYYVLFVQVCMLLCNKICVKMSSAASYSKTFPYYKYQASQYYFQIPFQNPPSLINQI